MNNNSNLRKRLEEYEDNYEPGEVESTEAICDICGASISKKEYDLNSGFCEDCLHIFAN